ncbi:MAG TPA: ATP-binding protein [Vicinamibacterales bacterium]|nr:ATP-binding protein [Vicinamibacterales bacterium]
MVPSSRVRRAFVLGRIIASIGIVALITLLYFQFLRVNPTTVALSYLVAILLIATEWGIVEGTAGSIAAALCFNFFFLPPVGTFTIADPQNWAAFVAFLATAIIASQVSGRARRREIEAAARESDLERLYTLSRALLLLPGDVSATGAIARHIASIFALEAVAIYDHHTDVVSWAGSRELPAIEDKLRDVVRRGMSIRDPSGIAITAIQLGGAPIGSLAMLDPTMSDTVLQSIANLVAIGLERARGQEATARAEAARQSGELRAMVLDALAHEFKTPLTSMKAAASDLLTNLSTSARDRELVTIIDEDLDRFQTLVTDAVHMLRIDAGKFAVHLGRHDLADVVTAVLRKLERRLEGHEVLTRLPPGLAVDADRELLELALGQLLDNALKYSPPTSTITIKAEAQGTGAVEISVHNSGSTIPEQEQTRIFERFYRGAQARHVTGTGMGLAIVQQIATAHGGTLSVASAADSGTTFALSLPPKILTAL